MSNIEVEIRMHLKMWQESEYDSKFLFSGLKAATASLWLTEHTEIIDNRDNMELFIKASLDSIGGAISVWIKKAHCPACGERYSLENMETCTDCQTTYCCRCIRNYKDMTSKKHNADDCNGEFY